MTQKSPARTILMIGPYHRNQKLVLAVAGSLTMLQAFEGRRLLLAVETGSRLHRALLISGVVGSLLFTTSYIIQGATRPGYGALRDTIRELSLGPLGWIQITTFVFFGACAMLSAAGLRTSLAPGFGASAIAVLKFAQGITLIVAGLFVTDPTRRRAAVAARQYPQSSVVRPGHPGLGRALRSPSAANVSVNDVRTRRSRCVERVEHFHEPFR